MVGIRPGDRLDQRAPGRPGGSLAAGWSNPNQAEATATGSFPTGTSRGPRSFVSWIRKLPSGSHSPPNPRKPMRCWICHSTQFFPSPVTTSVSVVTRCSIPARGLDHLGLGPVAPIRRERPVRAPDLLGGGLAEVILAGRAGPGGAAGEDEHLVICLPGKPRGRVGLQGIGAGLAGGGREEVQRAGRAHLASRSSPPGCASSKPAISHPGTSCPG